MAPSVRPTIPTATSSAPQVYPLAADGTLVLVTIWMASLLNGSFGFEPPAEDHPIDALVLRNDNFGCVPWLLAATASVDNGSDVGESIEHAASSTTSGDSTSRFIQPPGG